MQSFSVKIQLVPIIGVLLLAGALTAQLQHQALPPSATQQLRSVAGRSLLDPNRFTMSHGLSMSFSSGSGLYGGPASLSVYSNQMRYLLTDNVVITNNLYLLQPGFADAGVPGEPNLRAYFQTAVNWRLSNNMHFSLGLSNLPVPRYSPNWGHYYSPYAGVAGPDQPELLER